MAATNKTRNSGSSNVLFNISNYKRNASRNASRSNIIVIAIVASRIIIIAAIIAGKRQQQQIAPPQTLNIAYARALLSTLM